MAIAACVVAVGAVVAMGAPRPDTPQELSLAGELIAVAAAATAISSPARDSSCGVSGLGAPIATTAPTATTHAAIAIGSRAWRRGLRPPAVPLAHAAPPAPPTRPPQPLAGRSTRPRARYGHRASGPRAAPNLRPRSPWPMRPARRPSGQAAQPSMAAELR